MEVGSDVFGCAEGGGGVGAMLSFIIEVLGGEQAEDWIFEGWCWYFEIYHLNPSHLEVNERLGRR